MKTINLTHGQVALVDDLDYDWVSTKKWSATYNKNTESFYAIGQCKTEEGKRTTIRMHQFIMGVKGRSNQIDHKDHNTLNNQRSNLRFVTNGQNRMSTGKRTKKSSQFKGVSWDKQSNKWRAYIRLNKKLKHLGFFTNEVDAALIYDKNAIELFGEYACTNRMLGLLPPL